MKSNASAYLNLKPCVWPYKTRFDCIISEITFIRHHKDTQQICVVETLLTYLFCV